jgi:AcrR family transcriptional regulator
MQTNLRLLRARADAICPPPPLTRRQQQTYDRIFIASTVLLAENGPYAISFPNLARALRISTATLRHHFIDIDDLLGAITITWLENILAMVCEIPASEPLRRRACYAATLRDRAPQQILLHAARDILPPDLAERITNLRKAIKQALAPPKPAARAKPPCVKQSLSLASMRLSRAATFCGSMPPLSAAMAAEVLAGPRATAARPP